MSGVYSRCRRAWSYSSEYTQALFFCADDEAVRDEALKIQMADGGNGNEGGTGNPDSPVNDRVLDGIEEDISDNETRSIENRVMLERLDLRTVWIMRLLVGLTVAVLARLIIMDLQLLAGLIALYLP